MESLQRPRGKLFRKYLVLIMTLVGATLLASSGLHLYRSYQDNKSSLLRLEREKALAAASKIEEFIKGIEHQIGLAVPSPGTGGEADLKEQIFEFRKVFRQVPAVTEIAYLDGAGKEQLRISRLAMNVIGSQADLSREPGFLEAKSGRTYFSPVHFRKESEPYMTIAVSGSGASAGVMMSEVNLKFIWDVISQLRIGKAGHAYVVDGNGRLIAHPDITLVLKQTDLSALSQVQASLARHSDQDVAATVMVARDPAGTRVLTAFAPIAPLGWSVFVEQPLQEAFEPLYSTLLQSALLVLVSLVLSAAGCLILARKMATPIRALQAGAARIGAGELGHRIDVHTGDELEALAEEFNRSTAKLQESHEGLEQKVAERTKELADANAGLTEALEQQTATSEILRMISSSPTDVQPVFDMIAENAQRLCGGHFCAVFRFDGELIHLAGHHGLSADGAMAYQRGFPLRPGRDSAIGRAIVDRAPAQVPDVQADPEYGQLTIARAVTFRSIVAVPMLRDSKPVGGIAVSRSRVGPFFDKQLALLGTFAEQAVIAIENVRLFTALEARNRDLTATGEILQVISRSPTDVQPVFDAIVRSAMRLLEGFSATLRRLVGGELHLVAFSTTSEPGDEALQGLSRLPLADDPLFAEVVRDRAPCLVTDVETDPRVGSRRREVARARGYRGMLVVPLLREDGVIGAITVTRRAPDPFTDDQIALLKTFADQAVIAIENVRLFKELGARTEALTRSVGELRALGEVSRAVNSSLDQQTVLTSIVSHAVQLSGADGGAIYEFDEVTQKFVLRATSQMEGEMVEALRANPIGLGEGAVGQAAATREPVQIPDILEGGPYTDRMREVAARLGLRAVLAVPLLREDRIVGGLVVRRRSPGQFEPGTVALLGTFAAQSTVAIQNARLFRELEDKGQQLEVANRHKSEFLASMSHELRTPLNAIIGFSEVLVERMFGDLSPKQAQYVEVILSSGRHLLALINDILDLSKVEAGRMELDLTRFDLRVALESALTLVRERATRHGLTLELTVDDRLADIVADERKVKQILLNLLSNAVKFTPEGGRIHLNAVAVDGMAEISVADSGIGIAPENQEVIFEEFRQVGTDYARNPEGTGLGLALVRKLVELHGGRIWVKSQVGVGSTFTFNIPVNP